VMGNDPIMWTIDLCCITGMACSDGFSSINKVPEM
jgi:hypothetical protein